MSEWYNTQIKIGDKNAARIKRAFLDRISRTDSRTSWAAVESAIPNGAYAVYNSIQWVKWAPGEQIQPAYQEMYKASETYLQKMAVKKEAVSLRLGPESFNMPNPEAEAWLLNWSGKEITNITSQELDTVRTVLANGQANKQTIEKTAKELRETLGLNKSQADAVLHYKQKLLESGKTSTQVDKLAEKYSNKLLKYRAETVALTESHTATNRAWSDSVKDAARSGVLDPTIYELYWLVANDDRLCERCMRLKGATSPLEHQSFKGVGIPPLHPRCRCTTIVQTKSGARKPPVSDLQVKEVRALQDYAKQGYEKMNFDLRHGEPVTEEVIAIDSVMQRSTLKSDEVLFRGLTNKNMLDNIHTLEGAIIKDPAFMSTSKDRNVATRFLDIAASEQNTKGILMEIRMPKGTHGIYMPDYISTETARSEKEVLLPRGSEFIVKRVQNLMVAGTSHVKLTLAPYIIKGMIRMVDKKDILKAKSHMNKFVDDGDGLIVIPGIQNGKDDRV